MTQLEKELLFTLKDVKSKLELINKYVMGGIEEMIARAEKSDIISIREHDGGAL